jgi:hypothetical protein
MTAMTNINIYSISYDKKEAAATTATATIRTTTAS